MGKRFSIDEVVLIGRSFDEYVRMFELDEDRLNDGKILDCAAGASSFTAELSGKGCDITACDILYDLPPDVLEKKCENDLLKVMRSLKGVEDMYVWDYFRNPDELKKHRTATYRAFIADYRRGRGDRYIKSELPDLPFDDDEFSLSLCSGLLFLYDDRLSYDFHKTSIQEMLRVSSGEVRIFPLVGLDGKRSVFADKIAGDLAGCARVETLKTGYEFMRGGDEMMLIRKNG